MTILTTIASFFVKLQDLLLLHLLRFITKSTSRPPPCPFRTTTAIPSRDPHRLIKVHIYTPPRPAVPHGTPIPVVINWHAGGFVLPCLGQDAGFCMKVADSVGCVVVDADYRKGPEWGFPCAVEDVRDVVTWVLGRPEVYDGGRVAFTGFSAGANLALGAALAGRSYVATSTTVVPRAVVAFYPPTDKTIPPESKTPVGPLINPTPLLISNLLTNSYPGPGIDTSNPLISPSRADINAFADSDFLFFTCDGDLLCAEAEELAGRLERRGGGGKVAVRRVEGVGHAWDKRAREGTLEGEKREECYAEAVKFLRESFGA
ncbi:hypothetical protein HDV00_003555 [Rhizophlyctis rosea]|nr:hypothetical protein HDV00_003555 [Rhizophlyctis rosea]